MKNDILHDDDICRMMDGLDDKYISEAMPARFAKNRRAFYAKILAAAASFALVACICIFAMGGLYVNLPEPSGLAVKMPPANGNICTSGVENSSGKGGIYEGMYITYGSVFYHYTDKNGAVKTAEYIDADIDEIISLISGKAENAKQTDEAPQGKYITLEVQIPSAGVERASIHITEKGEVYTDIFGEYVKFSVSGRKARRVMRDIIKNCRGYELT